MVDEQIIKLFNEFKSETGKYVDFDISKLKMETIPFSDTSKFKFIHGKTHYIANYINNNKGNIPLLTSSLDNNGIADYVNPKNQEDIVTNCITFNQENAAGSRAVYRDYQCVMSRHCNAILPLNGIYGKYIALNLNHILIVNGYGWGENIAKTEVIKNVKIGIPQKISETYTSFKIQEVLVEFIEYNSLKNNYGIKIIKGKILPKINKIDKIFLPQFFDKEESMCNLFNAYAKDKGFDLKLEDVEFDTKRVKSNNKNLLVGRQRMGFTPKKISSGDINWFSVRDLGKNIDLFINNPNTIEKTTIDLIKNKIDKNRTGKSEKLIPIKKNDVLVSFKLTVGVTKIYNSELPAYCNEAIDIITPNENISSRFLAYNCMQEYPMVGDRTNNGITLNDDHKKKIEIHIPKDTQNSTSYELQELFADFIENYFERIEKMRNISKGLMSKYNEFTETIISKTLKA